MDSRDDSCRGSLTWRLVSRNKYALKKGNEYPYKRDAWETGTLYVDDTSLWKTMP
jgi:hypothetical protein